MSNKEMLLERIARNWKLIKGFEGEKVRGKRSYLKKFYEVRDSLEKPSMLML